MKIPSTAVLSLAAFTAGVIVMMVRPSIPEKGLGYTPETLPLTVAGPRQGGDSASGRSSGLGRKAEAARRLGAMTGAEARERLMKLPIPPGKADEAWWSALLARWAEDDAPAALEWLKKAAAGQAMAYNLALPALTAAARHDLRAALEAARVWPYRQQEDLFREAARTDPEKTVKFAAANARSFDRGLSTAFSAWLENDPDAALHWLQTEGKFQTQAIVRRASDAFLNLSPEKWSALLAGLPRNDQESLISLKAIAEGRRKPQEMLAKLSGLKGRERAGALEGIVAGLTRNGDAGKLLELLTSLRSGDRSVAGSQFMQSLENIPPEKLAAFSKSDALTFQERLSLIQHSTRQSPEEFLQAFEDLKKTAGPGADDQSIRDAVKSKWSHSLLFGEEGNFQSFGKALVEGKADMALALELLRGFQLDGWTTAADRILENIPESHRAASLALRALMAGLKDPSADLSPLLDEKLSPADRNEVLTAVLAARDRNDPSQRKQQAALLAQLPSEIRQDALTVIISSGRQDIADFAPLVQGMASSAKEWTPALKQSVSAVAQSIARQDPAAGFAWAENAPQEHGRADVLHNVFGTVVYSNPIAASEWLSTQPPGTSRDNLAMQLVFRIEASDPAGAWQWAASITSNKGMRQDLLDRILPRWQAADPVAATQAAKDVQSPVP